MPCRRLAHFKMITLSTKNFQFNELQSHHFKMRSNQIAQFNLHSHMSLKKQKI